MNIILFSLKRYIAFERLLKLEINYKRLKNYFKNVLPTPNCGEAGTKRPHKRKFNFDNFYPKYERFGIAQTLFH